MNAVTCQAAVHAASDQLAGLLSDAERSEPEDHLAGCHADTMAHGLAAALERLAAERRPVVESPAAPTAGSDPDADEAELFHPGFYTDGPDAGAWVDPPPVAWGEARVLGPDDDVLIPEEEPVAGRAPADAVTGQSVLAGLVGHERNSLRCEIDRSRVPDERRRG